MWTGKEENAYVIHLQWRKVRLFIRDWKNEPLKYIFVFSFMLCSERFPRASLWEWFYFDEGQLQRTNNTLMRKCKLYNFFFFSFRAIRTRTVDLLGKTDQTYYYQNDSNCFKDPTCIFFALGSFINWYKYQLVHHTFSWQKDKEMAPCALIHYLYSESGALPKCFKEGLSWRRSASGLDQPKLNGVSSVLLKKANMKLHTP